MIIDGEYFKPKFLIVMNIFQFYTLAEGVGLRFDPFERPEILCKEITIKPGPTPFDPPFGIANVYRQSDIDRIVSETRQRPSLWKEIDEKLRVS